MNIKTGTMWMQNFHCFSLNAAGLEPRCGNLELVLRGCCQPVTIWGAQGFRVRLTDGLARTKITPTSVPTAQRQPTQNCHPFHILRVGNFGGGLIRKRGVALRVQGTALLSAWLIGDRHVRLKNFRARRTQPGLVDASQSCSAQARMMIVAVPKLRIVSAARCAPMQLPTKKKIPSEPRTLAIPRNRMRDR